jgi:cyclohexanecarboxylate-CoA ligase
MSTSPNEILTGARTLWELVDRRADASPDHAMLIAADGETVTFSEFRARAERVAAGLQAMGVTDGSVVSWQLPTGIDTIVLSMAARCRTRSSTCTASARSASRCARPAPRSS